MRDRGRVFRAMRSLTGVSVDYERLNRQRDLRGLFHGS